MNNSISLKALSYALILTISIMLLEIIGGILSRSLALINDAGHMLMDSISLMIGFIALKISGKKPTENKTYGFYRAEIISAFINGIPTRFRCILYFQRSIYKATRTYEYS